MRYFLLSSLNSLELVYQSGLKSWIVIIDEELLCFMVISSHLITPFYFSWKGLSLVKIPQILKMKKSSASLITTSHCTQSECTWSSLYTTVMIMMMMATMMMILTLIVIQNFKKKKNLWNEVVRKSLLINRWAVEMRKLPKSTNAQ